MQNEKVNTEESVSPETQQKIDVVLGKIRKNIQDSGLKLEPLNDGSGYCGTYSFNFNPLKTQPNSGINFQLRITDSHNKKVELKEEHITVGKSSIPLVEKAVVELMKDQYELFYYSKLTSNLSKLDDKKLGFFITRELKEVENKYPKEFSFKYPSQQADYFCNIGKNSPSAKRAKTDFRITLRNAADLHTENMKTDYIRSAVTILFTAGTNDLNELEGLNNRIKNIIRNNGIVEYDLSNGGMIHNDKKIPKEWINLEKITLSEANHKDGSKTYKIKLVAKDAGKRQPEIYKSLGKTSKEDANKIVDYLKGELLPAYSIGEHKDEPLTLSIITRNIIERFPNVGKKPIAQREQRSDIRHIVINGNEKLRLLTPMVSGQNEHCVIHISPPERGDISGKYRSLIVPLNTHDERLIQSRTLSVQALSEVILQEYFKQNPDIKVAEGEIKSKVGDKIIQQIVLRKPDPGEIAPKGMVFLDTLIEEHLKPAYQQFNRFIYWQTDAKKEEDGTYKITAQIMRNKNTEPFPENDKILGKTWEFSAKDEKEATVFCRNLERNILRKEHLFSVERPVERFGLVSMQLVAKESLKEALHSSKEVNLSNKTDEYLLQNGRAIN